MTWAWRNRSEASRKANREAVKKLRDDRGKRGLCKQCGGIVPCSQCSARARRWRNADGWLVCCQTTERHRAGCTAFQEQSR